jgi:hypothetical protein
VEGSGFSVTENFGCYPTNIKKTSKFSMGNRSKETSSETHNINNFESSRQQLNLYRDTKLME